MTDEQTPGIAQLDAIAHGTIPAEPVAAAVKSALLSPAWQRFQRGFRVLWMAEGYKRRAEFERENFADTPHFRVIREFSLPLTLDDGELAVIGRHLTTWLGSGDVDIDTFAQVIAVLDAIGPKLGATNGRLENKVTLDSPAATALARAKEQPLWFPGSNYSEEPMKADGVDSFADELALIVKLGDRIRETVARVAAVSECPRAHGNHAKATVLRATFEMDPTAREEWRELMGHGQLHGGLRMSNSSPDLTTVDHKNNLIGFRFSFQTDPTREAFTTSNQEGGWFTLTANSAAWAHVRTPERHVQFTDSVGSPQSSVLQLLASVVAHSDGPIRAARDVARTIGELKLAVPQGKAVGARPRMNDLTFFSRHGYRLGAQAIRYVFNVVEPRFPDPSPDWKDDPDYRHRTLLAVLGERDVVVRISLQVLPDYTGTDAAAKTMHMIEDMRSDWTDVPREPFGVVRIPRQSVAPSAERSRMVEWFSRNPVDLVKAGGPFAPLGAAARSRTIVYEASREARAESPPLGVPPRLATESELLEDSHRSVEKKVP